MDALEAHLNDLVLDISKTLLRHPKLDEFHQSPKAMLEFLSQHFDDMAEQQRREDEIAIGGQDVEKIIRNVLLESLAGTSYRSTIMTAHPPSALTAPGQERALRLWYVDTLDAPMVAQRSLREKLAQLNINATALGEVIDMCRFIDHQATNEQQKTAGAPPFGTVNLVHFAAVLVTLAPSANLFELIKTLFSTEDTPAGPNQPVLPDLLKIKMLHAWALIDVENKEALERLVDVVIQYRGLDSLSLLEVFPEIRFIGTDRYAAAVAASAGASDAGAAPMVSSSNVADGERPGTASGRVVVYAEESDPVDLLAALGDMPPVCNNVVTHSAGDGGADEAGEGDSGEDEEDADGPVQRSAEDQAFWDQLVS